MIGSHSSSSSTSCCSSALLFIDRCLHREIRRVVPSRSLNSDPVHTWATSRNRMNATPTFVLVRCQFNRKCESQSTSMNDTLAPWFAGLEISTMVEYACVFQCEPRALDIRSAHTNE